MLFSLFVIAYSKSTKLFKEKFHFEVTPEKLCMGGPYMWKGDSEKSKFCRELGSTTAGMEDIHSYECGPGFVGMPRRKFDYTPLSNDNWENIQCDTT